MNVLGLLDKLRIRRSAGLTTVALMMGPAVCFPAGAQGLGLHAGITAQLVQRKPGYTEPAQLQLAFLLVNHSDSALDVAPNSWKIVVDDVELLDSGFIFGNGPMPQDGWKPLLPDNTTNWERHSRRISISLIRKSAGCRGEAKVFTSAIVTVKISSHG